MGTFHLEATIDRPPDDVFAVIADPTTMPHWYDAVRQVTRMSPGPTTAGATYAITRSLPGGEAHNIAEITEYEASRRVTLESRDGPTPFRYRYTLQSPSRGTTRIMLDGTISATGLPGVMGSVDPLATRLFERGMRRNLSELRRIVESAPAPPGT